MFGGHFVFSSGLLDQEEFHRIMKKVQGRFRQNTADDATQRFRRMGATGLNKVLTLEETDFLFALIDTDGSGTISVKEFAGFLKESERNKGTSLLYMLVVLCNFPYRQHYENTCSDHFEG